VVYTKKYTVYPKKFLNETYNERWKPGAGRAADGREDRGRQPPWRQLRRTFPKTNHSTEELCSCFLVGLRLGARRPPTHCRTKTSSAPRFCAVVGDVQGSLVMFVVIMAAASLYSGFCRGWGSCVALKGAHDFDPILCRRTFPQPFTLNPNPFFPAKKLETPERGWGGDGGGRERGGGARAHLARGGVGGYFP
jgi:hypothetical protein